MPRWAVFDVDGTLLPGTSMEKMFLLYGVRRGLIPLQNLFCWAASTLPGMARGKLSEALKGNKRYLRNLKVEEVEEAGRTFFETEIWPRFSKEGLAELQKRRSDGFRIMIMSGSPDFLTNQLAEKLKPDFLIATTLERNAGRFTGQVLGLHPYGSRKAEILKQLQPDLGIDFSHSAVFANHFHDADHMQLFAEAVATNPDRKLRKLAAEKKWPVVFWSPGL